MLIALSGGADSVALLLMMHERGEAEAAAHCNFHLRGEESNRDEQFVRDLCQKLGVRLFVKHFNTEEEAQRTGESIEMAARRLRYDWFEALRKAHGFSNVAVAHHRDDNAETILLNLVRGTGLRGLTGMESERPGVVRPLLNLSRRDILNYLQARHQPFVTDSTNADTHFRRNKLRHEVLPLLAEMNPNVVRTLNDMGERLRGVERIYRYGVNCLLKQLTVSPDNHADVLRLKLSELKQTPAPETLLFEVLSGYGFTPAQAEQALHMGVGAFMESAAYCLTRQANLLCVAAKPQPFEPLTLPALPTEAVWKHSRLLFRCSDGRQCITFTLMPRSCLTAIPRSRSTVALDADSLCGNLVVRRPLNADRFQPFGMRGTKLLSDLLTNRHYSRIDKLHALVVTDDEGIVWVVNERPAARCAITDSTRHVLLVSTEAEVAPGSSKCSSDCSSEL